VLDLVHAPLGLLHGARIGQRERLLQDDRPAVHALVHEVDGHAGQLDPVLERLLDRPHTREGRQQRRVHVHDPAREAADESRTEDLHEARQHHQAHAPLLQPVAERPVALVAVGVGVAREDGRLHAGAACTLEPPGALPARGYGGDVDRVVVEQRLQVGALPGDQYRDRKAHAATRSTG
jgi:hypothetical protein